jgi:hypothetical protein
MNAMNTHYPEPTRIESVNRHTLAVVVDNEPGALARIAGLFSGRGYNIESLTVSDHEAQLALQRLPLKRQIDDAVHRHEAVELRLDLVDHGVGAGGDDSAPAPSTPR